LQLTIRTHGDIREIPEASWDAVAGQDRLICTHRFLRAVQESRVNDCRFFYPVLCAGEKPVANACMYLITSELDMFGDGLLGRCVGAVARRFPSLTRFRSLECGTPVALGTTVSVAPGIELAPVLARLAEEAIRLADEHGADGVLFRDFVDEELPGFSALEGHGFLRVPNLCLASLAVRWRTEEEYVASLRHSYRRAYRRRRQALASAGVSVRVVTDFAALADRLAALWRQTYERAREYRREVLPADFFRQISAELGEDSEVLLLEREGRCLAFALLLIDGPRLVWPYCGLDYGANEDYELYFNLLHEIVSRGILRHVQEIDMGITTLDAKKRLGATTQSLHMYMRHRQAWLRGLAPRLFRWLTPGDDTPDYRVFRGANAGEL
jgi:predicted N-acyltransferase